MKRILYLLALLLPLSAAAADRITATVTITNAPTTNGMTFVITTTGASTRTWTNNVVTPSVQILTNIVAPGIASNLQAHLEANPPAGVQSTQSSTSPTNLTISAQAGIPLTISGAGSYFTVSYATQAVTTALTVRTPPSVEAATTKTNVGNGLIDWLEGNWITNSLFQSSTAASELVGLTNAQSISGIKTFSGTNRYYGGGFYNPTLTNGVNQGNAFSSVGTGTSAEQFGSGATATADRGTAIGATATAAENAIAGGYGAAANGLGSVAIGRVSEANGTAAVVIGNGSVSDSDYNIVIGDTSIAQETSGVSIGRGSGVNDSSVAIGYGATAFVTNSVALGAGAIATADRQIMLGTANEAVYMPSNATTHGTLQVDFAINGVIGSTTNGTLFNPLAQGATLQQFTAKWTNVFPANSDISFARLANSSLANGNNAGVIVGTNVFMEVSGPSGAFTINGITASPNRDGKLIIIVNQTGQTMTIANESGVDATAGNRIRTGYGADITVTNNPGCVQLIYSGSASRWLITSKTP